MSAPVISSVAHLPLPSFPRRRESRCPTGHTCAPAHRAPRREPTTWSSGTAALSFRAEPRNPSGAPRSCCALGTPLMVSLSNHSRHCRPLLAISALLPTIPASPRHSREGGNPGAQPGTRARQRTERHAESRLRGPAEQPPCHFERSREIPRGRPAHAALGNPAHGEPVEPPRRSCESTRSVRNLAWKPAHGESGNPAHGELVEPPPPPSPLLPFPLSSSFPPLPVIPAKAGTTVGDPDP